MAVFIVTFHAATVDGQTTPPDQSDIAQQLLSEDKVQRARGLEKAEAIPPRYLTPALRTALITALERENAINLQRFMADERDEALGLLEDPEFVGRVSRAVAALEDPNAIPALAGALGSGFTAVRALVAFGEQAIPAVVEVVTSSRSMPDAVNHGLITLRLMIERAGSGLSKAAASRVRQAATLRLTGKQRFATTVWRAIDLAVVLNDPSLTEIVKSLATSPSEVLARGIEDAELIQRTQKRAADRLAGVPALPRL